MVSSAESTRDRRALVIYHADCTDGACAAWAARHHLHRAGFHVVTLPTHPGITPEGAFAEEWGHVFVVDVCIPRADAERLRAWVLDHHKTNQPLLAGYERAFFDMSRSGAGLAWDEVQAILWGEGCGVVPRAERPWFVLYVEDRDLWRWALPQSREVNAALCLLGRDVDVFDDLLAKGSGGFIEDGRAILKAQADAVQRACRHPLRGSLFGVPVVHVASPNHQSEIGERLTAEHGTVAVVWYLREDSERGPVAQVSIRSRDELADASELAAMLGGGGHRNAAGAVVAAAAWLRQIAARPEGRTFIASPLRGDIARNQRYARIALKDSLDRGEAPFVPHLLYDQVLDDTVEAQRAQAINAALAFLGGCDVLAVYTDLGISEGMRGEIERAKALGLQVVERSLGSLFREAGAPVARCERCNWPLAASLAEGCVPGNCSLREVRP